MIATETTCPRCKGTIEPGQLTVKYNRPSIGTLYHKACPTLAPAPTAPIAPTLDLDALVAKLAPKLAPKPTEPEPACGVQCPESCADYSHNLVCDGYEAPGFDCAGFDWLPELAPAPEPAPDGRTLSARESDFMVDVSAALAGAGYMATESWDHALAASLMGATPQEAKGMLQFSRGVLEGMLAAAHAMPEPAAKVARVEAMSRDMWRRTQSELSLAVLVDDDAADAMMASEAKAATACDGCTCLTQVDDDGVDRIVTVGPACAPKGATVGATWNDSQHHLWS